MNAKTMELAIAATIAYYGDESMLDNAKQYDGMVTGARSDRLLSLSPGRTICVRV